MVWKKFSDLPPEMRNEMVYHYYSILRKKQVSLIFKRLFDIVVSSVIIILMFPLYIVVSIVIIADSKGSPFYLQTRATQYGRLFKCLKFRTMLKNAEKTGPGITSKGDARITRIGLILRRYRIDETLQAINVFLGSMTFVGTRPEAIRYVSAYTDEMRATLLLPAGITSDASIFYKDEALALENSDDIDYDYIHKVLPAKMFYNLKALMNLSLWGDIKTMVRTVLAVCGKKYAPTAGHTVSAEAAVTEEVTIGGM